MTTQPYLSLIIPAYNEVQRIGETLTQAMGYFESHSIDYQIVVSADGNDGTRERATEVAHGDPRISVIGSAERGGKGRGIRQAVPLCSGQIIGFTDADNKTPITEFDKIDPYLRQGAQIVIGSRGLAESQIERRQPLYRQIGSRGFGIVMHSIVGLHDIIDTQCGFKFFRQTIAQDLFARQQIDGYMYDVEILYLARHAGYSIVQVPVRWRDDGDSRSNTIGSSIRFVRELIGIRFAKRTAAPVAKSMKK